MQTLPNSDIVYLTSVLMLIYSVSAVALYLADQWWAIDDIVKTSVPSREGLKQVTRFCAFNSVSYEAISQCVSHKQ